MTYPDVYLCMPAEYAELFKTTKELYIASGMSSDPSSSVAATIRTACTEEGLNGVGASAFIKINTNKQPSDDSYFAGSKTSTPPYKDACVYGKASFSGVTPERAHSGVFQGEIKDAGGIDNVSATLVSVSSLLPPPWPNTYSNRTHSFCSSFPSLQPLRALACRGFRCTIRVTRRASSTRR